MILHLISLLLLFQSGEVPFRGKDDFLVELKYNFKEKPARDANTVAWEATPGKRPSGPLPYLIVNVKILNAKQEEIRFKCENNLGRALFNRKAEKGLSYDIDMGYIDDVKDRVTAHMYTLYALSENREAINKIELLVMEDGTFMVNGEKRGKF
jgi:hypothetical protein